MKTAIHFNRRLFLLLVAMFILATLCLPASTMQPALWLLKLLPLGSGAAIMHGNPPCFKLLDYLQIHTP